MNNYPVRLLDAEGESSDLYAWLGRFAENCGVFCDPVNALQCLEVNPAHVLITRLPFEEMNGLGVARTLKEVDRETGHYTHIILVSDQTLNQGSEANSDVDLVLSNNEAARLLPRLVESSLRLSEQVNRLQKSNIALQKRCSDFQNTELIDQLTGLGNCRYLDKSLDDCIAQIEARGGAICVIYIGLANGEEVTNDFGKEVLDDLLQQLGERIRHSVRPLDVVTYLGNSQFALVLNQPGIDECVPESYVRIYDGLRHKSYQTKAGFISVTVGMGFCASAADTGPPKKEYLCSAASRCMKESIGKQEICYERFVP